MAASPQAPAFVCPYSSQRPWIWPIYLQCQASRSHRSSESHSQSRHKCDMHSPRNLRGAGQLCRLPMCIAIIPTTMNRCSFRGTPLISSLCLSSIMRGTRSFGRLTMCRRALLRPWYLIAFVCKAPLPLRTWLHTGEAHIDSQDLEEMDRPLVDDEGL